MIVIDRCGQIIANHIISAQADLPGGFLRCGTSAGDNSIARQKAAPCLYLITGKIVSYIEG